MRQVTSLQQCGHAQTYDRRYNATMTEERDRISQLTDVQLKAMDQLQTQTHRIVGLLDEFEGNPMLSDNEQEIVAEMFECANALDNSVYARLEAAKKRRGLSTDDHVDDHIDLDLRSQR